MHVAIIMGGSERWMPPAGLPRSLADGKSAEAMRTTVAAAACSGVATLTLYTRAIHAATRWDPLRRRSVPNPETSLLLRYLLSDTRPCVEQSIRIHVIGLRERMDESVRCAVEQSERASATGSGMRLRIVVDYSLHDRLVRAAWSGDTRRRVTPEEFHRLLQELDASAIAAGAVDLLIRTGREKRLSDFMLWEAAYAELHFARCRWPDFTARHFESALRDYLERQRRVEALMADAG